MIRTYGRAGYGARQQTINAAMQRLAPRNTKRKSRTVSEPVLSAKRKLALLGLIASGFAAIWFELGGLWTWICWIAAFAVFLSAPKREVPLSMAPRRDNSGSDNNDSDAYDPHTTRQMLEDAYDVLRRGGSIADSPFEGDEIRWALGGIAEEHTAWLLRQHLEDRFTVINDIELVNERGKVTANIDHLVLARRGAIMVDTKAWADPLEFTTRGKDCWLEKDSNRVAWSAVSTCLYEAHLLPSQPRAIIFAVGGKAGRAPELERGTVRVTKYYERFGDNDRLRNCDIPVYFVAQSQIATAVWGVDNSGIPTHSGLSLNTCRQARNVRWEDKEM